MISDAKQGAIFYIYYLKDLFLASPMEHPEYMRILWKYIRDNIQTIFNIETIVEYGCYIYVNIKREKYGLQQAAVLAYDNLVDNTSL